MANCAIYLLNKTINMKKFIEKIIHFLINGSELKPGNHYAVLKSNL